MTAEELKNSPECRDLRRKIQAIRIKRLGWSDYVFRYILSELGYSDHLRDMGQEELAEVYQTLSQYRRSGLPVEYEYDKQGRYMHSLVKKAGWEDHTLRAYLTIHYNKTHWNLLSKEERRAVIKQLQTITNGGNT